MSAYGGAVAPQLDADVTHGAHGPAKGMDSALVGMLLFIGSEVMFFASLFGVYFNVRATAPIWPPEGTEFLTWQGVSLLITIVLVSSSFTMTWGTLRIRKGDRVGMNRGIVVTMLLGVTFLGLVAYEYYNFV